MTRTRHHDGNDGATARFLAALYGTAPPGSLVEVRYLASAGMRRRFHTADGRAVLAVDILRLARRTDVFVGVLPRRRRGGGRDDLCERASVVWVDCDSDASVAALAAAQLRPTIEVASGSGQHRHAYWKLREPVPLDVIEDVNRRLAFALGGDARCADAARILRPPGSANWKSGQRAPVRLIALRDQGIDVAELTRQLPAPAVEPATRGPRSHDSLDGDRLLTLSPRVYVQRLLGTPVGRDGKVRCPFHEDRTPSLHVYEDPGRGWYCYGCGRGGSIYDLAAPLLGRDTRGQDFLKLRRELTTILD